MMLWYDLNRFGGDFARVFGGQVAGTERYCIVLLACLGHLITLEIWLWCSCYMFTRRRQRGYVVNLEGSKSIGEEISSPIPRDFFVNSNAIVGRAT